MLPDKTTMICILEIQGVRFTSQSFQFEVEVKQIAVVSPDPYLDTCFVKIATKSRPKLEDEDNMDKPMNVLPTSIETLNDLKPDLEIRSEKEVKPEAESTIMADIPRAELSDASSDASIKQPQEDDFSMLSTDDIDEVKQALNVSFNPSVNVQTIPAAKAKGKKTGGIKIIEPSSEPTNMEKAENDGNSNSLLDFEDMDEKIPKEEKKMDEIEEIVLDEIIEDKDALFNGKNEASLILKKPDEIYREMFRVALAKADEAKRQADQLYLEADEIKQKYELRDT